jgi:23S rRNA pseudouridine1911/1915/1917 synthase
VNIPIIYEDEWLLVLDKPSGLLVIPTPRNERRTLTSILNDDALERGLSIRLYPCHRLDRETSGLIVYAKARSVQEKVMDLFKKREISKKYIAFVRGRIVPRQGQIDRPVDGKSAITRYRVIEEKKDFSVVELFPQTGRTNQIRIHFMAIGHPLVGETKFARRKDSPIKIKRVCLHAAALAFTHPFTGAHIALESTLPKELAVIAGDKR